MAVDFIAKAKLREQRPLIIVIVFAAIAGIIATTTLFALASNMTVDFTKPLNKMADKPFSSTISTYGQTPIINSASQRENLASLALGYYRVPLQWNGGNIVSSAGGHPGGSGDDWIANIKAIKGTPMIVIGGNKDNDFTPEDAANLVRHFNTGSNPNRVDHWIIGNEPGNEGMSIDAYCDLFNKSVDAMKAVDSSIKVGGPAWAYYDAGTLQKFLNCAGAKTDIVDYHHYAMGETSLSDQDALNQTQRWEDEVSQTRQAINQAVPARANQIEIQVGEYNFSWRTEDGTPGWQGNDRFYQAVNTVWGASVAGHIAKAGGRGHQYADLNGALGLTFEKDDAASHYGKKLTDPMPIYHGLRMFSGGNLFRGFGNTMVEATSSIPDVEIYASNDKKNIVVINKSPDKTQDAAIQLHGFEQGTAEVWQTNKDAPFDAPQHKATLTIKDKVEYQLPPYSVTTFVLNEGASTGQPPAPSAQSLVKYGRYFFDHDGINSPATQATRWPIEIRQGNHLQEAMAVKAADPNNVRMYVYATPAAQRAGDPNGYTTSILPSTVKQEWLLKDSGGNLLHRTQNDDYALDFGNVDYQQTSAQFLVAKAQNEHWDGVFLDEINTNPTYAFNPRPAKYPDDASWQQATTAYVQYVCGELHKAGKLCSLNIGGDNDWALQTAKLADSSMVEFFMALDPNLGFGDVATVENGLWANQLRWAEQLEGNTHQPFFHASTTDPKLIDYSLGAYMLINQGHGVFAASRDYGDNSDANNYTQAMQDALKLGAATGNYTQDDSGVYYRTFQNGKVIVNPHNGPRTYGDMTLEATSARVILNSAISLPPPVTPGPSVNKVPLRINVGGEAYTDPAGDVWQADFGFNGGNTDNQAAGKAIGNTNMQPLYQDERWGNFSYQLPIANGTYKVRLHFAEIYEPCQTPGCRVFNVKAQDEPWLTNYDIAAKVGSYKALIEEKTVTVNNGSLDLTFTAVTGAAQLAGLEVLPDTAPPLPPQPGPAPTPMPTPPPAPTPPPSQPTGLRATYYDSLDFSGKSVSRIDPAIDFDWGNDNPSPDPQISHDRFSTRWVGEITPPASDTYTFYLTGDDGVRLWVDGKLLIDGWHDQSPHEYSAQATLNGGHPYHIRVEYYENWGGDAIAKLEWSTEHMARHVVPAEALSPNVPQGLTSSYYQYLGRGKLGKLIYSGSDQKIDFDWGDKAPNAYVPATRYAITWVGKVTAPATGTYTFTTESDDGVRLWVDGKRIISDWHDHSRKRDKGTIALNAGQQYDVKLMYYQNYGDALIHLMWNLPGQAPSVVPATAFSQN